MQAYFSFYTKFPSYCARISYCILKPSSIHQTNIFLIRKDDFFQEHLKLFLGYCRKEELEKLARLIDVYTLSPSFLIDVSFFIILFLQAYSDIVYIFCDHISFIIFLPLNLKAAHFLAEKKAWIVVGQWKQLNFSWCFFRQTLVV